MKRNLILTGWSKSEYLAAAAAAYEALKADADVAGVSISAALDLLDAYDHQAIAKPKIDASCVELTYELAA